jgi:outer membrane protein W
MMKKLAIILAFGIMVSIQAVSQNNFNLAYAIGLPVGDLGEYISRASFRGVAFDYNNMITDNIALGFSTGWNVFYEDEESATYTYENKSLTGKQYRYSNHVPILFCGTYYLKPDQKMNPFGSLGIGAIYSRRDIEMGVYTERQEAWNFALSPEIGIKYEISEGNGISFSVQYNNGFKSGNELDAAQSFFAIKIGYSL